MGLVLTPKQASLVKETVTRVENLEAEKRGINEDIKKLFAVAKENNLDPKRLKKLIQLRRKNPQEIEYENEVVETYDAAMQQFEPING